MLAKTLGNVYEENNDKKSTLKKLYYASTEANKRLKELESERDAMTRDIGIKQEKYLNLEVTYQSK